MNAPKLRVVHSRDEILEAALRALTAIVGDPDQFPDEARRKCRAAHAELHALRSPQTVRQMERDMGITPGGDAA
jgi:hypothetical protein